MDLYARGRILNILRTVLSRKNLRIWVHEASIRKESHSPLEKWQSYW